MHFFFLFATIKVFTSCAYLVGDNLHCLTHKNSIILSCDHQMYIFKKGSDREFGNRLLCSCLSGRPSLQKLFQNTEQIFFKFSNGTVPSYWRLSPDIQSKNPNVRVSQSWGSIFRDYNHIARNLQRLWDYTAF